MMMVFCLLTVASINQTEIDNVKEGQCERRFK